MPDPNFEPDEDRILDAALRSGFGTVSTGSGSKAARRRANGLPVGKPPFGYIVRVDSIALDPNVGVDLLEHIVPDAFQTAADFPDNPYARVAEFLNDEEFPTPSRRGRWNKDNARSWLQHPLHAGYNKYPVKPGDKRGPFECDPAYRITHPPVDLSLWLAANVRLAESGRISFPNGFRTLEDRIAWEENQR